MTPLPSGKSLGFRHTLHIVITMGSTSQYGLRTPLSKIDIRTAHSGSLTVPWVSPRLRVTREDAAGDLPVAPVSTGSE